MLAIVDAFTRAEKRKFSYWAVRAIGNIQRGRERFLSANPRLPVWKRARLREIAYGEVPAQKGEAPIEELSEQLGRGALAEELTREHAQERGDEG